MLVVFSQKAVVKKIAQHPVSLTHVFLEIELWDSIDGGIFLSTVLALPKGGVSTHAALVTDRTLVFRQVHKTLNSIRVVVLALRVVQMFP